MSEAPDKPEDQPSGQPQPDEEERPQRRQVSEDELTQVLEAHRKWLLSDGKDGEQAILHGVDLERYNLKGAILNRADLQGAYLEGAILNRANFQGADLRNAKLQRANLREANLGGANLQGANLHGAKLQGADLVKAFLQGANLRGAKLQGAKLQGANLSMAALDKANLSQAVLFDANLSEAKLHTADLTETDLRGAIFKRAILINTKLRQARLDGADLATATGLLSGQFSDTSLTGAELPNAIAEFEGLAHVEEISKNARKIFFGLLLGCVYSWLTIATTTDVRLLTNSASSPLPIIGTEIPIAWFYRAAPLVLLSVYFYLHLYLQHLWDGLAKLPAIFPDGKALQERAYPWLLNGLVRAHMFHLKNKRPPASYLENFVSIFLAWWIVPITLLGFWLRYLPRQDGAGTILLIAYFVIASGFGWLTYFWARGALRGRDRQKISIKSVPWKGLWRDRLTYVSAVAAIFVIVLPFLSYGAVNPERVGEASLTDLRTWLRYGCFQLGCITYPRANFKEAVVSIRPANYWEIEKDDRAKSVIGAHLRNASLISADADKAFLAKADLQRANLQGADLNGANLEGANLQDADLQRANLQGANLKEAVLLDANLQKADLWEADLRGANLQGAKLQGAKLQGANLQSANLQGAKLQGANLQGAKLQGAKLQGAKLQGADLGGAKLQGADFRVTKGLTQKQLDEACADAQTKPPPNLSVKRCPKESK